MAFSSPNLGLGIAFFMKDMFSSVAQKIKTNYQGLSKGVSKINNAVMGSIENMQKGLGTILTGVAIAAPFALAVNASAEFNHELARTKAISSATTEQMELMKQAALDVAGATEFSAQEAAGGLTNLAMAGLNATDSITALPNVLDLATIGSISLAQSADIATNVMSGFGKEAGDLSHIMDVMAKTATTSNTDIVQMGEAMKLIAPQANSLGVSIEEVAASIGFLANAGLKGSVATASMRTAITRLGKEGSPAQKEMQRLGITAFDNQGKFLGLAGVIGQVEGATSGMTDAQKLNTMTQIFGAEASTQFTALMNTGIKVMKDGKMQTIKGAEALQYMTKEMVNSGGAAKAMAAIMRDTLTGDLKTLSSQWDNMMISIGDALEPVVRPFVQGLSKMISLVGEFVRSPFGSFLTKVVGVLAGIVSTLFILAGAFTIAEAAAMAFGAIIGIVGWPITLIVVGIGVLVAALFELDKHFQIFDKIGILFDGLSEVFKSATDDGFEMSKGVHDALEGMGLLPFVEFMGTVFVRMKAMFRGFGDTIVSEFQPVFELLGHLWDGFVFLVGGVGWVIGKIFSLFGNMKSEVSGFEVIGKAIAHLVLMPIKGILLAIRTANSAIGFVKSLFGSDVDEDVKKGGSGLVPKGSDGSGVVDTEGSDDGGIKEALGESVQNTHNNETNNIKNIAKNLVPTPQNTGGSKEITIINQIDGDEVARKTMKIQEDEMLRE